MPCHTIFSSGDRWLEVSIESETLSPRQRINGVAFAFRAAEALYAETAGDSDSLDGMDSADFVKTSGATMTGSPSLIADGLVAGFDQLILSGGNVGVGTQSPGEKLEVSGDGKFIAEPGTCSRTSAIPVQMGLTMTATAWWIIQTTPSAYRPETGGNQ